MRASVCASKRFARTCRPDQQNIRFRQLDFAAALLIHLNPLVMVIHSDRQLLLGGFLTNHILIQIFLQFQRPRQLAGGAVALIVTIVFNDRIAYSDAFVADVCPGIVTRRRNELTDNVLAFVTKRTAKGIVGSGALQSGLLASLAAKCLVNTQK